MNQLHVRLKWFRDADGYAVGGHDKYSPRIVNRGGPIIATEPLLHNDSVFKAFADVRSGRDLLSFVENYGLLQFPAYGQDVPGYGFCLGPQIFASDEEGILKGRDPPIELEGESVSEHLETAALFREILIQSNKGWKTVPRRLASRMEDALLDQDLGTLALRDDRKHGLSIVLSASSLLNGLWFQLATHIGEGAGFRLCELPSCGKLFQVGVKAGRRADARFCSRQHQIDFNSGLRSLRHRKTQPS